MTRFLNACIWTPTLGGTATWIVAAAVPPYVTPANCVGPAVVDGGIYNYVAISGSDRERGWGIYTAAGQTLTRNVTASTNGGAAVNFAAPPIVHMGVPLADNFLSGAGAFVKTDPWSVAFTKTGLATISIKAETKIELNGVIYSYEVDTAVQMPTLNAGTDYAIYICNDGTVRADASFTAPAGFDATTSRQIGGFHYAPGGNAAAQAGGNSTPEINEYSLWDLKFRPACPDPRGMALVADGFWVDIYVLNVDHIINGTSKHGATIADGSNPPKIPTAFGGNGSNAYGSLTWWEAAEVLASHGKQLLDYAEFAAAAYGVTEATSAGSEPSTTALDAARTSKWGVMQAAGGMWIWGRDLLTRWDGTGGWNWRNNAGGRGHLYIGGDVNIVAATFGSSAGNSGATSGSRAAAWFYEPWTSGSIGARGRCDHLCHV